MGVLRDEDLYALIRNEQLINPAPSQPDRYDRESSVQASSIDLHIGKVFVPGLKNPSGEPIPKEEWSLKTGQLAILSTLERLRLPGDVAGIGFPPSRVSIRGLLMTNPGHIDPGYEGTLHLTVINMGRDTFELKKGDLIVTVVLLKIAARPKAHWQDRNGLPGPDQAPESALEHLSQDFVSVTERAQAIAKEAVDRANLAIQQADLVNKRNGVWVEWKKARYALVGSVVVALLSLVAAIANTHYASKAEMEDVKADLEKRVDAQIQLELRIQELKNRLDLIDDRTAGRKK